MAAEPLESRQQNRPTPFAVAFALSALLAPHAGAGSSRHLAEALAVTTSPRDLAANPQLLARLRGSAHGYFRFVNVPFSQEVCERFQDVLQDLPAVNLHGDAHVEQWAVTSLGRGLTDFDDSSTGPFVIDLMRFGVSLRLAARAHGWERHEKEALDALLRGYRAALEDPAFVAPEPALAGRLRATFTGDHALRLREADSLMHSPEVTSPFFRLAAAEYVSSLLAAHPELPRDFFEVKKSGILHMGIGSALDRKFLARVEGPTRSDDDDVLLEAKEVKDISMIACVNAPPGAGRILAGHSRIANQPFAFAGFFRAEGVTFWVHSWPDDYVEVQVRTLESPRDLVELALDAGAQMGRGAPRALPGAEGSLRKEIRASLDRHEGRIRKEIGAFTTATFEAWKTFRKQSANLVRPEISRP
ncbi:MAG: DUF2252 family protein [Vicinamibacteria bacterium]